MKKHWITAAAVLTLALAAAGSAQAAARTDSSAQAQEKDSGEEKQIAVKDGKKTITVYEPVKDRVYVTARESAIRELPQEGSEEVKEVTWGKWLNQIGICENGWTVVTYRDEENRKCTGYLPSGQLSDQELIEEVPEEEQEASAAEDVEILDYPSLKEGRSLGEYIEGDTVRRIGICNEDWSQVAFTGEKGKTVKGFVPTRSLDGIEEEAETPADEEEIGAIRPGSGEGIFVDASNKVTAGGTIQDNVIVGDAVAVPENAKLLPLGTFRITHYCQCSLCCGPWANGITSTGVTARTNHTIAVDPSQIPYGSKVVINGQVYVAEDCGGAITENCIDIYVASHEEGETKGVYYTDVYLLEE